MAAGGSTIVQQACWPLYDLFLDLPHPAASRSCPSPILIPSPDSPDEDLTQRLQQITLFSFPEYEQSQQQQANKSSSSLLNKFDRYAMQVPGFQHFTFTMQLQSGTRVYGHVRRYLPLHPQASTRYDVGRRGERALVIMTRAKGADRLYAAILKSSEALLSLQNSISKAILPREESLRWFFHAMFNYQQHLAKQYQSRPVQERGKPMMAALQGLEISESPLYKMFDVHRFIIPTSLLRQPSTTDPATTQSTCILPLFRCIDITHSLRLFAALLSERRVILISSSPTRLANCSHAALSMLAQGLLHWQHIYIPVLPPHLWQYLAAPFPYLIGILTTTASRLDRTDGLGEVLILNLDFNTLETRGIADEDIATRLPDLFANRSSSQYGYMRSSQDSIGGGGGSGSSGPIVLSPDALAQDLTDIMRDDKRILYGETAMQAMSKTAERATNLVKGTFNKWKERSRQALGARNSIIGDNVEQESASGCEVKSLAADYIYTEGCHNETCEESARVAFTTFFLCMFGNMKWYLTGSAGQLPQLDCNRFLQQKRSQGEGEGTAMWFLLQNFVQTQLLAEFAKARVEEIRTRQVVAPDDPLFLQCANYHRQHNIDFSPFSVRKVASQIAEGSPSRMNGMLQINARRTAMALTSTKSFEGDFNGAIADLVEQCREGSAVLTDVMSVIWMRFRDARGTQWKHAFNSLHILRNLLFHGPLNAVTEAIDGLDQIRAMKFYENGRPQLVFQVRGLADNVYNLLIDRSRLFHIRRVCADKRRQLKHPYPKPVRDNRVQVTTAFRNLHAAYDPSHRNANISSTELRRASTATVPNIQPVDLFLEPSLDNKQQGRTIDMTVQATSENLLDILSAPAAEPFASGNNDLFGLFDSMNVTANPNSQHSGQSAPIPSLPSKVLSANALVPAQSISIPRANVSSTAQSPQPVSHQHIQASQMTQRVAPQTNVHLGQAGNLSAHANSASTHTLYNNQRNSLCGPVSNQFGPFSEKTTTGTYGDGQAFDLATQPYVSRHSIQLPIHITSPTIPQQQNQQHYLSQPGYAQNLAAQQQQQQQQQPHMQYQQQQQLHQQQPQPKKNPFDPFA